MSALKELVSGHHTVWRFFMPLKEVHAALCVAIEQLPRWSLGAVEENKILCIRTTNSGFIDDVTLLLSTERSSGATLIDFSAINRKGIYDFGQCKRNAAELYGALPMRVKPFSPDVKAEVPPEFADVVRDLRKPEAVGGLEIRDRYHFFTRYRECFVASDMVSWLVSYQVVKTREEAVIYAQRLQQLGILEHVVDSKPFEDGVFYYRFQL
mmetsp:Transcript_25744/g.64641  ORF Transcript_25744/g.64641 Transcript_25744/m.64641 type:complete len:210 (+) Transcript_25744:29-658(+)